MKVIGYICCALALTYVQELINAEKSEDKFERELFDVLAPDEEPPKIKRPFCNAFTGCGRKRSLYESSSNAWDSERKENVVLPVSFYKTLLRAAVSQKFQNAPVRESHERRLPHTMTDYVIYPAHRMTSPKRGQS